jgi:hypothetical protein
VFVRKLNATPQVQKQFTRRGFLIPHLHQACPATHKLLDYLEMGGFAGEPFVCDRIDRRKFEMHIFSGGGKGNAKDDSRPAE